MFVPTRIGHSTDTPIWCSRSSRHSTSASATTPYLATQYGPRPLFGTRPANDAVNRMWPPSPCSTMRGRNASTPWMGPQRSTSMVQRQSSWVIASTGPPTAIPALLNTTCTPPSALNEASASACTASSDRTSHTTPWASAPPSRSRCTATSSAPSSTSARTSLAPLAAITSAVASPIPLAPPVMTAPFPRNVSTAASSHPCPRPDPAGRRRVESIRGDLLGHIPCRWCSAPMPPAWRRSR